MKTDSRKPLFRTGANFRGNVFLNRLDRSQEETALFAHAFHMAGKKLVRAAKRSRIGFRGTAAFQAYPIVYVYRHALELYLKAILWTGLPLLASKEEKKAKDVLNEHKLRPLVGYVERVYSAAAVDVSMLREVVGVVEKFDEVDAGSFAFRYPTTRAGSPALAEYFSFSVPEFAKALDAVLTQLDGAATQVYEYVHEPP